MKKVTIGDLDYYYAKEKVNCFNPDVMKISSYHKQKGDAVNFVTTEDDIRRPYDIYYIIKEKDTTPNPPLDFYTNKKVKWWGDAYRVKVKGKMSDAMLGCRPDYLLYPEYNTQLERAEHVRFFNNKAELLPLYQDYTNSFKNKKIIITDKNMWFANNKSIIIALKRLEETKNLYFLEPISLKKIIYDEELKEQFLRLKLSPGANLQWYKIKQDEFDRAIEFLLELKKLNPRISLGVIKIDYADRGQDHGASHESALKDFEALKRCILIGKRNKIKVHVDMPKQALETPYSYIFSVISEGTNYGRHTQSWLEYITKKFGDKVEEDAVFYGNNPSQGNELFRDMLRQTYTDHEFLLTEWGDKCRTEIDIPGQLWDQEFKYKL